jgi:hypothetical protein
VKQEPQGRDKPPSWWSALTEDQQGTVLNIAFVVAIVGAACLGIAFILWSYFAVAAHYAPRSLL